MRSAVADCGLLVGTTSRARHLPWRVVEPREAAREIAAASATSEVAILFGAERTGLSNEDIEHCQLLLGIPTGAAYTSLNVAMAVQIVAYEVLLATRGEEAAAAARGIALASATDMERFYDHLEQVLEEVDFRDRNGEGHLMARIRRLFNRTLLDQNEVNILRGILTSVQGKRRRAGEPHPPRDGRTVVSTVVYLDNAATTPVDPRVIEVMLECCGPDGDFANPSAVGHEPGRRARGRVEQARAEVARLVGATPEQIVWTSGATEADNLALFGAARFHRSRGRHIVTSRTEHPAVLDPCRQLEREGFEVTYLKPGADGIVAPEQVAAVLRDDTILVSLMHVNNEIGVVQDIGAVGRACRARGVLLHVDAAQSAGKLAIDVERDCVDLLALTAHKVHGPKGVGALCVRREPRLGLVPLLYGGGQERGLRSGTVPTHQVAGMGRAFAIAAEQMAAEATRIGALRERLWAALATLPGLSVERASGAPRARHPERDGRRRGGREPAAVAPGSRGRLGVRVRQHERRAVLRAACARAQRPPGAEHAAAQSRAIHDRRARRLRCPRVREEVERLRAIAPPGVGAGQR